MTDPNWRTIDRRLVYENRPWMRIYSESVALPDGRRVDDYHRIDLMDFAAIAAIAEDGRYVVIRQYKHGAGRVSLTLPGGMIDADETPLQAAQRELREETGYEAPRWGLLHRIVLHGNHRCCEGHIFLARGARKVVEPESGDLEDMQIVLLTEAEVRRGLRDNDFVLAGTASAMALILAGIIPEGV